MIIINNNIHCYYYCYYYIHVHRLEHSTQGKTTQCIWDAPVTFLFSEVAILRLPPNFSVHRLQKKSLWNVFFKWEYLVMGHVDRMCQTSWCNFSLNHRYPQNMWAIRSNLRWAMAQKKHSWLMIIGAVEVRPISLQVCMCIIGYDIILPLIFNPLNGHKYV